MVTFMLAAMLWITPSLPLDASWWTTDAGGAAWGLAGDYQFGATVGQPDAAQAFAGWYRLDGGYWPGAMVRRSVGYIPVGSGYLALDQRATYGQITIIALALILVAAWRLRRYRQTP